MTRNLSIIEIDYHSEVLRDFCKILNELDYRVIVYTTEKVFLQTGLSKAELAPKFTFRIIDKTKNIPDFFNKWHSEIEASDLLFFNTLASHFKFFSRLTFSNKVVLRIHNAGTYLGLADLDLGSSFSEWQYSIEHLIWRSLFRFDWYFRKTFLKRVDYFVFPSDSMIQFSLTEGRQRDKIIKSPFLLTYAAFGAETVADSQSFRITIPGSVEPKRRDYDSVLNAFELIQSRFEQKVELVLLGPLKTRFGKDLVNRFSKLENVKLIFFSDFVEQETFKEVMIDSNILLLPIKVNTRYQIYQEKYGLTKISGGEGEMIKYCKRAIIPIEYNISNDLKPFSMQYANVEELAELILRSSKVNGKHDQEIFEKFNLQQVSRSMDSGLKAISSL